MLKNHSKIKVEPGTKRYYNDEGEYHRLDGPAFENSNGTKFWYINGNRHRNIDPSSEWWDGEKFWYFKGKAHRVGGSCSSLDEWWYIHGKEYIKQQYFNIVWDI